MGETSSLETSVTHLLPDFGNIVSVTIVSHWKELL